MLQVLGYVPKVEDCVIESRHLGLVLPDEIPELKDRLHKLAGVLEETLGHRPDPGTGGRGTGSCWMRRPESVILISDSPRTGADRRGGG